MQNTLTRIRVEVWNVVLWNCGTVGRVFRLGLGGFDPLTAFGGRKSYGMGKKFTPRFQSCYQFSPGLLEKRTDMKKKEVGYIKEVGTGERRLTTQKDT